MKFIGKSQPSGIYDTLYYITRNSQHWRNENKFLESRARDRK